jgi:hypothetical protein
VDRRLEPARGLAAIVRSRGPREQEAAPHRATNYFHADLHKTLRLKAADTHRSISEIVNDAVRQSMHEDREDLEAVRNRIAEPTMTCEALLEDLKAYGKL